MKNKELIERLKALPEDMEVCVFDFLRNEREYDGEPSSAGVYKDFQVDIINKENDDADEWAAKWIMLGFKNKYIEEEE